MAGVTSSVDIYKELRPSQIIKSEDKVSQPVQILGNYYINPFSITFKTTKLFNLSSGAAVEDHLAEKILKITDVGRSLVETFRNFRLIQHNISFHVPVKRNSNGIFKDKLKSAVVKKDNQSMTLQVNRNIIGALLSYNGYYYPRKRVELLTLKGFKSLTASFTFEHCKRLYLLTFVDRSHRETSKSKM